MRTTEKENTSNRSLTDAELDQVSGGSLLTDAWDAYCVAYDIAFGHWDNFAPLEGHLQRR
jgi:hypothetical protein